MPSSRAQAIVQLLQTTMDTGVCEAPSEISEALLESLGFDPSSEIHMSREKRIELAMLAIREGANISKVVGVLTWKDFEGFVAGILVENNYSCTESYRRRGNTHIHGMEIDVIGLRGRTILSVDAKLWGVRGGKASALKTAALKQRERTVSLAQEIEGLAAKMNSMKAGEYSIYPLVVTWLVEDVEIHEGIPIVPIFKLNSFVLSFDQYEDMIASSTGYL